MNVNREKLKKRISEKFDELKDDEEMSNMLLEAKWRDIMANEYMSKEKGKIEALKAGYQLSLDKCDSVVVRLQDWSVESEAQYQFNLTGHRKTMEKFMDLANKRLTTEKDNWEKKVQKLVDGYEIERTETLTNFKKHSNEVNDITNAISHEYSEKKDRLAQKFRIEKDNITMKSQDATTTLTMHLKDKIAKVNEEMKISNKDYKDKSENKMSQFHTLFDDHKRMQKEMCENEKLIAKHAADISHWRRKIKTNEIESKEENDRLRQEKETLSLHFRELKETMSRFRTIEAKKLAEISVAYEDTITEMEKKLSLAENILKYAEMNRKLETEREQIMPFPNSISDKDPEIQRQMRNFKMQLKGDSKYVDESDLFEKFYRRYNKVLLETLALEREKQSLDATNKHLKKLLSRYMDGLGVREDVLSNPNTLVIVNQNTNAPKEQYDEDVIPVVDADFTIHANHLQGY